MGRAASLYRLAKSVNADHVAPQMERVSPDAAVR